MACPSSSDADVAYRGCVLRYSGAQIPTDVRFDVNSSYAFHTVINAARVLDTDAFTEVRRVLFTDLASAAAASPLMMASGNRMFNATHNLYGLAQCNRDMRREQCSSSITGAIQSIQDYGFSEEMWSEGLSITGFSIYIRDVEEAEAAACLDGVRLVGRWPEKKVVLIRDGLCGTVWELDRSMVVSLVHAIREEGSRLIDLLVVKCRREQNKVTHELAQLAIRSNHSRVSFSFVPGCIQDLVLSERSVMGVNVA
nr:unnamed protein product [Digitaria exilis]